MGGAAIENIGRIISKAAKFRAKVGEKVFWCVENDG